MVNSGVDWLGEIPSHWELRRARYMFRQSTSKGNDRLVLLSATQDRGVVDKSTLDSVVQVAADADLSLFKTVHKNDFVISLRSFQGGFEISHEEGVISPAYTVFRLSTQTYPHYYRHLFKSYGFIDKINSLTVGIREGKNIQYVDFANMLLPYISLAEQQRIAEFLDRKCVEVDEMIALQEQIIEELKAYKQSVITEAVTKGLNPDVPMKDSGIDWIGQIPEHWEVTKFYRICSVITDFVASGSFESLRINVPYLDYPDYAMLVRTVDLSGKGRAAEKVYISKHSYDFLNNSNLFGGEIILPNIGASVGDVYIVPNLYERMSLAPNSIMFKTKQCDKYWYYYFYSEAGKQSIFDICQSTAQPKFNKTELRDIRVCIPTNDEQRAIADYLDKKCADIDSLIQTKQSKIDSLKEYKKSIIYEYVTGKKEVTE